MYYCLSHFSPDHIPYICSFSLTLSPAFLLWIISERMTRKSEKMENWPPLKRSGHLIIKAQLHNHSHSQWKCWCGGVPMDWRQLHVSVQKRRLNLREFCYSSSHNCVVELKLQAAKVILFLTLHPVSEIVGIFVSQKLTHLSTYLLSNGCAQALVPGEASRHCFFLLL